MRKVRVKKNTHNSQTANEKQNIILNAWSEHKQNKFKKT